MPRDLPKSTFEMEPRKLSVRSWPESNFKAGPGGTSTRISTMGRRTSAGISWASFGWRLAAAKFSAGGHRELPWNRFRFICSAKRFRQPS